MAALRPMSRCDLPSAPRACKLSGKSSQFGLREESMAGYEFCKIERDGKLLIVTINRPDVMNAVHPPANHELAKVFDDFAADPELWVAIVTGAGEKAFSAGNDLKYTASGQKMSVPASGFGGLTSRYDLN